MENKEPTFRFQVIFTRMDDKEKHLRDQLVRTLSEFKKIVGDDCQGLCLRVDSNTKTAIEKLDIGVQFQLIHDIPEQEHYGPLKSLKSVAFRWVWSLPSLKRSYAGRIAT